jgi:transcriptional regulator
VKAARRRRRKPNTTGGWTGLRGDRRNFHSTSLEELTLSFNESNFGGMYIPPYADVKDLDLLAEFIEGHPFGSLVTSSIEGPSISFYPFLLERTGGDFTLWTHLAKSNPQWKEIGQNPKCLVSFQGPHGYISPSYYKTPLNVPTWNYAVAQAKCEAEMIQDPNGMRELMERLVAHFEKQNGTDWKYDLPEEFDKRLLSAIVGIKLKVTEIEGKFKLSQNRKPEDYEMVEKEFAKRTSDNDRELFGYMQKTKPFAK